MKYIPTKQDVDAIKKAASRESSPHVPLRSIILESGVRYNTESDRGESINIALISEDADWNDTDLADMGYWDDFRKGIELTADGRGIFDFYIRRRDPSGCGELHGNVTIEVADGKLSRIYGYDTVKGNNYPLMIED